MYVHSKKANNSISVTERGEASSIQLSQNLLQLHSDAAALYTPFEA